MLAMKEFRQLLQNVLTVGVMEPKTLAATDNISIHSNAVLQGSWTTFPIKPVHKEEIRCT